MTTPANNPISLTDVMNELRVANPGRPYPISLNDSDVRALAGVPSGTISMSDLLNKSSVVMQNPGYNGQSYSGPIGQQTEYCYLILNTNGTWTVTSAGSVYASGTFAIGGGASGFVYQVTAVSLTANNGTGYYSNTATSTTGWTAVSNAPACYVYTYNNGPTTGGNGTTGATIAATFTVQIAPAGNLSKAITTTVNLKANSTLTISGASCVAVDSFLPGLIRAGDIIVGDMMDLGDAETMAPGVGQVSYSMPALQPGLRFATKSGASLKCSESAPIPTLHRGLVTPGHLLGEFVAVRRFANGEYFNDWEEVVSVDNIGEIMVQHITVGNNCFWAGEQAGVYILHHNIKN